MIRPVDAATARQSLRRKGFQPADGKRDHEMYFLWVGGLKTRFMVKISHGAKEVRRDEIRINAQAARIDGNDLYRILTCDHDAAKTVALYREAFPGEAGTEK